MESWWYFFGVQLDLFPNTGPFHLLSHTCHGQKLCQLWIISNAGGLSGPYLANDLNIFLPRWTKYDWTPNNGLKIEPILPAISGSIGILSLSLWQNQFGAWRSWHFWTSQCPCYTTIVHPVLMNFLRKMASAKFEKLQNQAFEARSIYARIWSITGIFSLFNRGASCDVWRPWDLCNLDDLGFSSHRDQWGDGNFEGEHGDGSMFLYCFYLLFFFSKMVSNFSETHQVARAIWFGWPRIGHRWFASLVVTPGWLMNLHEY